ncbi:MAG: hypothetical protein Solumvirus1_17 [Solumvirus sp.]|uniref:Uncharacterized protein n=1 Tax=Solumvirus sp. TaxID=2487773 RepID=A0A3G5AG48_9VIRU|nr:MAG: hypothetical protein Solumvirus1_17 [Solumvirus sp.]
MNDKNNELVLRDILEDFNDDFPRLISMRIDSILNDSEDLIGYRYNRKDEILLNKPSSILLYIYHLTFLLMKSDDPLLKYINDFKRVAIEGNLFGFNNDPTPPMIRKDIEKSGRYREHDTLGYYTSIGDGRYAQHGKFITYNTNYRIVQESFYEYGTLEKLVVYAIHNDFSISKILEAKYRYSKMVEVSLIGQYYSSTVNIVGKYIFTCVNDVKTSNLLVYIQYNIRLLHMSGGTKKGIVMDLLNPNIVKSYGIMPVGISFLSSEYESSKNTGIRRYLSYHNDDKTIESIPRELYYHQFTYFHTLSIFPKEITAIIYSYMDPDIMYLLLQAKKTLLPYIKNDDIREEIELINTAFGISDKSI